MPSEPTCTSNLSGHLPGERRHQGLGRAGAGVSRGQSIRWNVPETGGGDEGVCFMPHTASTVALMHASQQFLKNRSKNF